MINPDFQFVAFDQLLIGFRGDSNERLHAINICRQFDGRVLLREGDVMVVEINGDPDFVDDFLLKLSCRCVTHLWRGGKAAMPAETAVRPETNFCGI